jgi:hypothetical protein
LDPQLAIASGRKAIAPVPSLRVIATDEQQACRLALAPRLLLRKPITSAPTGRVTAWATKQSPVADRRIAIDAKR